MKTKLKTWFQALKFWVATGGLTETRLLTLYRSINELYYRDYQAFNLTSGQRVWIRTMKGGPEILVWDKRYFLRYDRFNNCVYCELEASEGHGGYLNLDLSAPEATELAIALNALRKFNPCVPSEEGVAYVG